MLTFPTSQFATTRSIVAFCVVAPLFYPALAPAALKVVTTTTPLASIARSVGGQHIAVESICDGTQDPHFIRARPSYMRTLASADLFIRVGLELEQSWESLLLRGSRNSRVQVGAPGHLDTSKGIQLRDVPSGNMDRSMGDVHGLGNPHYWLDPLNGRLIARAIAERLVQLDQAHSADYRENSRRFVDSLDRKMFGGALVQKIGGDALWAAEVSGQLANVLKQHQAESLLAGWKKDAESFQQASVVTFHRSWSYFTGRFGINVVGYLEPKPGIHPGPGHLQSIIATTRTKNAKLLLLEPFYDQSVANYVSEHASVPVLVAPNAPARATGGEGYVATIDYLVAALKRAVAE